MLRSVEQQRAAAACPLQRRWSPIAQRHSFPALRMDGNDEAAEDTNLPPLPSITSVEFYGDVLENDVSVSARSLGRVEEIGIFPLGMVLNPGAVIPLHIFEMRYRQLFSQAWDGDTKVGVVMYDRERNQWARVGTFCQVTEFQTQPDGRIFTVNEGDARFRVLKVTRAGSQMQFAKALVEYHDDLDSDEDLTQLEDEVWTSLKQVLKLSNELYGKHLDLRDKIKALAPGEGLSEDGGQRPEGSESARQRLFSFAVCQVLDMPILDQQLMLQMQNTSERLRKQLELLQQAQQFLSAQVSLKNADRKSVV